MYHYLFINIQGRESPFLHFPQKFCPPALLLHFPPLSSLSWETFP